MSCERTIIYVHEYVCVHKIKESNEAFCVPNVSYFLHAIPAVTRSVK